MTDGTLQPAFNYKNITASASTQIKTIEGILHTIVVNTSVASAVVYDGISGSAAIATISSSVPICLVYDIQFNNGLSVVTTAGCNITVGYV